ncbi:excisionase family DNA-binding protein [Bacillus pinisoli]|uniref:excisionase family DNA-binding protein n=1 Tax=Bacillus pinisoli TaxID=2901866 RepID=UPI001FF5E230|nr:excisionase family DNA-binding protein [Bacillus pinisoli]
MFLTVKEAAEYLSISEKDMVKLIQQQKIKAIHDGEQYVINKNQFDTHLKQVEKYKKLVEEVMSEPIPEDLDIKDED